MVNLLLVFLLLLTFVLWRFVFFPPLRGKIEKALAGIHGPQPRGVIGFLFGNLPRYQRGYHIALDEWRKKYGRIYKIYIGRMPQLVTSAPELVYQICIKNFSAFHDRPPFPLALRESRGLLFSTGKYWDKMRRMLSPAFNTAHLKSFTPLMNSSIDLLLARLDKAVESKDPTVNIWQFFGALTMQVIGTTSFGVNIPSLEDGGDSHPLVVAARKLFRATSGRARPFAGFIVAFPFLKKFLSKIPTRWRRDMQQTVTIIDSTSLQIAAERRKQHAEGYDAANSDFVDIMLKMRDRETGEKLTDIELRDHSNTFLLAGYETTANALSYAVHLVSHHPEVERALVEEIDRNSAMYSGRLPDLDELDRDFPYLDAVLQETLRLFPPAGAVTRVARSDVTLTLPEKEGGGSLNLPAGTVVAIPIYAIHRDPELFSEPLSFKPERFLRTNDVLEQLNSENPEDTSRKPEKYRNCHIPFGLGPRRCIGERFALQEAKLTLLKLYSKFRFVPLANQGNALELPLEAGITLSPANGVFVKVERRSRA